MNPDRVLTAIEFPIPLVPGTLGAGELGFLHTTTVDYVLTTPEGQPLLAVEFDGLGHGYSQDGRYVQSAPVRRDPSREWKLSLKVRIADEVHFPLMVISYDEKTELDPATGLTLAHGLIGEYLAYHHLHKGTHEPLFDDDEADWLSRLPSDEQFEITQDRITAREVDADIRWNPVARLEARLMARLVRAGPGTSWSYRHLEDGDRPPECDLYGESFDARKLREWMDSRPRMGCEATVTTPQLTVTRSVWIRRVSTLGVDPICLVAQAACVLSTRAALGPEAG
jgi:hypothetical protein